MKIAGNQMHYKRKQN